MKRGQTAKRGSGNHASQIVNELKSKVWDKKYSMGTHNRDLMDPTQVTISTTTGKAQSRYHNMKPKNAYSPITSKPNLGGAPSTNKYTDGLHILDEHNSISFGTHATSKSAITLKTHTNNIVKHANAISNA